nr:hypothetical protein [Rhizobium aethiopicum]
MFEEEDNEPDPHRKKLAQLSSYNQRTRQPVEPDPVRYRRQPLRHPQHRIPLFPLVADLVTGTMLQDGAIRAPFLIPGCWIAPADMISARNEHYLLLLPYPRRRRRARRFGSRVADRQCGRSRHSA